MRILFLVPYPLQYAPSQRFRVEMLLPLLDKKGIEYDIVPFLSSSTYSILYKRGYFFSKVAGIVRGYCRRLYTVIIKGQYYSRVFIHREAAPFGPPVLEWWLYKVAGKHMIYDFDDAIWLSDIHNENRWKRLVKAAWKTRFLCNWAKAVCAGNRYLYEYAQQHSSGQMFLMPTVVDTERMYNRVKEHRQEDIVIGWTGSHSTLQYLDMIIPVLQDLQHYYDFTFVVIADKDPRPALRKYEFIRWNIESEIDDLLKIDIGVMPLTTDVWSEGKCGFKLIQYMALGIPSVASPVGVNGEIITSDYNGILCNTPEDWFQQLAQLLTDVEKRERIGAHGRETIHRKYSINAQEKAFLELFVE